ncbi:trihelix transcription factor ASIL1 [Punica granatum]|uniref:Trihelix transcription factor ASIL1 n=1 Tax=Punica granatum TaxID=22663 RepID=A0A218X0D8_PUNGR|nr:trihelix transcription factor ASIL1 [Punica granatum]OWM78457.1 hypothetical protein CDL15_Pgr016181 [Punica granatum]
MEKDTSTTPAAHHQHNPSLLPKEESPRRSPALISGAGGSSGGGDRLKRDEWSEGAVSTLLEAYEAKWVLRNRAKLKGHDWEDVARFVSSRANCTKSHKTQTQCKNKIESMKKRYRSESAAPDPSSWPLYQRLDMLLRGNAATLPPPQQPPASQLPIINPTFALLEPPPPPPPAPPPPPPAPAAAPAPVPPPGVAQNSLGSNGVDRVAAKEDGAGTKVSDQVSDKNPIETDSSTPALYSHENQGLKSKKLKMMKRKKKKMVAAGGRKKGSSEEWEIADSIRWLAEAIVRSEQSRMETMKEVERMRIEAETKRGEMDLKRTEIIANTQLEIARLLAGGGSGKGIDSSLRIGRN